jgi:glucose/arabinose dehydrogenase
LSAAWALINGQPSSAGHFLTVIPLALGLEPRSQSILLTLKVYLPAPWRAATAPQPGGGLTVKALAHGLDQPRWLLALPNGDVFLADTRSVLLSGLLSPLGMALFDMVVRVPPQAIVA